MSSAFRVYVPTTDHASAITLIDDIGDPAAGSLATLDNETEWLPITEDYDRFVKTVIGRLLGHGATHLHVAKPITAGKSWQLAVSLGHALDMRGRLVPDGAGPDANGFRQQGLLWATGRVGSRDRSILEVGYVAQKLERSFQDGLFQDAKAAGRRIVVMIPPANADAVSAPLRARLQSVGAELVFPATLDEAFERVGLPLPRAAVAADPEPPTFYDGAPYPGLAAFARDQAAIFFGRDLALEESLGRLRDAAIRGRGFLLIHGRSGVGKSSLMHAGLVPEIADLVAAEGRNLLAVSLRPGPADSPALELVDALSKAAPAASKAMSLDLETRLQRLLDDPEGILAEWGIPSVVAGRPPAMQILLDQTEQMLGQADPRTLPQFGSLIDILSQTGRVWIMATLRTDQLGLLERAPPLAAIATDQSLYRLAPPSPFAIREMITAPAELAGYDFDPRRSGAPSLPDHLAELSLGSEDTLPLLQVVLQRLAELAGPDRRLTWDNYRSLGEFEGAVQRLADGAVRKLEAAGVARDDVDRVLAELIAIEPNGRQALARTVPLAAAGPPARAAILRHLVDERLAIVDDGPNGAFVRLSHEALLRNWDRLKALAETLREDLVLRDEIETRAAIWEASGLDDDALMRGKAEVRAARDLKARGFAVLRAEQPDAADFVARSRAARLATLRAARAVRAERKAAATRERRLTRQLLGAALTGLVAAIGVAVYFNHLNTLLSEGRRIAEERGAAALLSESDFIAEIARQEYERGDYGNALGLALRALPEDPDNPDARPISPAAEQVLINTVPALREEVVLRDIDAPIRSAIGLRDGRVLYWTETNPYVVTDWGSADRRAFEPDRNLLYWDPARDETGVFAPYEGDLTDVLELRDGRIVIFTAPDLSDFEALMSHDPALAYQAAFVDPDGTVSPAFALDSLVGDAIELSDGRILALSASGPAQLFDPDGTPIARLGTASSAGALPLADAGLLTWGEATDGTPSLTLWQQDGRAGTPLAGHVDAVLDAVALPGGGFVTTDMSGRALLWNSDGSRAATFDARHGAVLGILALRDGRLLTWGHADGSTLIWNMDGPEPEPERFSEAENFRLQLPDGRLLSLGAEDLRIVDLDGRAGPFLRGHESWMRAADILPDGRILTWGDEPSLRIWNPGTTLARGIEGDANGAAGAIVLRDGRVLTWTDIARIWNAEGTESTPRARHRGLVRGALELSDGRIMSWSRRIAGIWPREGDGGRAMLFDEDQSFDAAAELPEGRILSWSRNSAAVWTKAGALLFSLPLEIEGIDGALALRSGRVLLWDNREETPWLWTPGAGETPVTFLRGHVGDVVGALELRDGRLLTWSDDTTARLWSAEGGAGRVLAGHGHHVTGARELEDGRILTWGADETARIWSADGSPGPVLAGHTDAVTGALGLRDGRILSWGWDNTARLWAADGSDATMLPGLHGAITGALELRDGRILTWRDTFEPLRLFAPDGSEGPVLHLGDRGIDDVAELPDGRLLVLSASTNFAQIVDPSLGGLIETGRIAQRRLVPLTADELCAFGLGSPSECRR